MSCSFPPNPIKFTMQMRVIYLFVVIYIISLNVSRAQTVIKSDSLDNLSYVEYRQTKSPTGAMLRSMAIPGWGQFYNEAYWKIPIVWAGLGAFAYAWKWNNDKVNYYDDLYHSEHESGYYELREFYRNQRDLNTVFFIIVYVMNVVDAYVDAHLFDFDIHENRFTLQPEARVNFKFPINRRNR